MSDLEGVVIRIKPDGVEFDPLDFGTGERLRVITLMVEYPDDGNTPPEPSSVRVISRQGLKIRDAPVNGARVGALAYGAERDVFEQRMIGNSVWVRISTSGQPERWCAFRVNATYYCEWM